MSYQIKIEYTTGDSFDSHDAIDYVELQWNSLEVAKKNLQRIKEHYLWLKDKNNGGWRLPKEKAIPEPEWRKELTYDRAIFLIKDDGTEMQYSTFWYDGIFDFLKVAEIEEVKGEDMRFEVK